MYNIENGYYPSNTEGLNILMGDESETDYKLAMIRRFPLDPSGNSFLYRNPEKIKKESFDVLSYGADVNEGGNGLDTDCGNWRNDYCELSSSSAQQCLLVYLSTCHLVYSNIRTYFRASFIFN